MSYNTSHFRPFLIFKSLSNRVRDIEYRNRYYSNHSLLYLELKIIEFMKKGKAFGNSTVHF